MTAMLDTLGLFAAAAGLPEQVEQAAAAPRRRRRGSACPHHDDDRARRRARAWAAAAWPATCCPSSPGRSWPVPVVVHKGYGLPNFVDRPHPRVRRVVLGRHRGDARGRQPRRSTPGRRVVAVTRGGELGRLADAVAARRGPDRRRHPHAAGRARGRGRSRRWCCSSASGCSPGASAWIDAAVEQLRGAASTSSWPRATRPTGWPGASGARCRSSTAGGGVGAVAARRWKTQFNENAKVPPPSATSMPELCHNEICGWGQNGDVTRQVFRIVNLRHEFEHPQIARRFELVDELLDEVVGGIDEVVAEGEGRAGPAVRPGAVRRLRRRCTGPPRRASTRARCPVLDELKRAPGRLAAARAARRARCGPG